MDCTLRYNILTVSQTYAFHVPVLLAYFEALRTAAKKGMKESVTDRRLSLYWLVRRLFGWQLRLHLRQSLPSGMI